jgi:hypothetical protein
LKGVSACKEFVKAAVRAALKNELAGVAWREYVSRLEFRARGGERRQEFCLLISGYR